MNPTVIRLQRAEDETMDVVIRIPIELVRKAHLESNGEVTVRAQSGRLIVEALEVNTEWMEIHAEEYATSHRELLLALAHAERADVSAE